MNTRTDRPLISLSLTDDFSPHSYDQWRAAADALLKGGDFDSRLRTRLAEGITLEPLYRREDCEGLEHLVDAFPGLGGGVRGNGPTGYIEQPWLVSQPLIADSAQALALVVQKALARGQTELNISLDASGIDTAQQLRDALKHAPLADTSVFLTGERDVADLLLDVAAQQGVDGDALRGCVGCDPLARWVTSGWTPRPHAATFDQLAEFVTKLLQRAPMLQSVVVDAGIYRNAGGHAVLELGIALATTVTIVRELKARGVTPTDIARRLRIVFGTGPNFFVEIAKLRAARHVLSKMLSAFGVDLDAGQAGQAGSPARPHVHCRSSSWNKTRLDPHVNLLRSTTEAFAAVIGGADSIELAPYDAWLGHGAANSELAQRSARNIQLVLAHECDLTPVIDPAGGSYYIEWLTDRIGRGAWKVLQSIEKDGGIVTALNVGSVQAQVAASAQAQRQGLAQRKTVLVGTNMYPLIDERFIDEPLIDEPTIDVQKARPPSGQTSADQPATPKAHTPNPASSNAGPHCTPLAIQRLAEPFEELRYRAERHRRQTGGRPAVLQLHIGPARDYRARADWTASFFAVGGFDVQSPTEIDTVSAAVDAAREATACTVVCFVASDDRYRADLVELLEAFSSVTPRRVLCAAGTPPEELTATRWKRAGLRFAIDRQANAYELLRELQRAAGVGA